MYQIFYIDIDEEITSVIDRLRKSKTKENFFVVSSRSLLLQSVVSLKLLKKEAEKEKKQIAIVVNDQESKVKIEKAGILALSSLKGLEGGEEIKENFNGAMEIKYNNKKNKNAMEKTNKKARLQKIGTEEFFNGENPIPEVPDQLASLTQSLSVEKKPEQRIEDISYSKSTENPRAPETPRNNPNVQDFSRDSMNFSYIPERKEEKSSSEKNPTSFGSNKINEMKNLDPYKERLVEGFFNSTPNNQNFSSQKNDSGINKNKEEKISVSCKMKKIVFAFLIVCIFSVLGIFSYLFIPKAKITVSTRAEMKKIDFEVKGVSNVDEVKSKELVIPAKIIEREDSITNSFNSTGKKNSASDLSKKSKGKIIVFNEYSSESQQLVATTRFISEDGKLFRLAKSVTVPGMSNSQPGSVEAEVIADQLGEEYNIGPSSFKIPGFEGSPKYEKFYAKSNSSMSGGGTSEQSGGISIISQSDIDNAKKDSELKLKEKIIDEIRNEMGEEKIILENAVEISILESSSSSKVNEVSSSFDYKVKGKVKLIVFSESDLKKVIGEIYNEANQEKKISDFSSIKVSYGISSADFEQEIVNIRFQSEILVDSSINWDEFKLKMLNKNEDQIKEILKEYPQIEKINIDFWPRFMSQKIPQYENRVTVEVN